MFTRLGELMIKLLCNEIRQIKALIRINIEATATLLHQ